MVDSPTTSRYLPFIFKRSRREPASSIAWRQWINRGMQWYAIFAVVISTIRGKENTRIPNHPMSKCFISLSMPLAVFVRNGLKDKWDTQHAQGTPIYLGKSRQWLRRLPDIRSFAQEHGCKSSENVNMSIIFSGRSINVRKSRCFILRLLVGFRKSWWNSCCVVSCRRKHRPEMTT